MISTGFVKNISFKAAVITLSDRASSGQYEDKSGYVLMTILKDFFAQQELSLELSYRLIPDEKELLHQALQGFILHDFQFIFTSGSTGIGPRDIAPDVVKPILTKEIPGIMESIRVKYAAIFPNASLSRSIAGVANKTLIYTLPGSPKAVKEYMDEIFKTLLHAHLMILGADTHK